MVLRAEHVRVPCVGSTLPALVRPFLTSLLPGFRAWCIIIACDVHFSFCVILACIGCWIVLIFTGKVFLLFSLLLLWLGSSEVLQA